MEAVVKFLESRSGPLSNTGPANPLGLGTGSLCNILHVARARSLSYWDGWRGIHRKLCGDQSSCLRGGLVSKGMSTYVVLYLWYKGYPCPVHTYSRDMMWTFEELGRKMDLGSVIGLGGTAPKRVWLRRFVKLSSVRVEWQETVRSHGLFLDIPSGLLGPVLSLPGAWVRWRSNWKMGMG